MKFIETRALHEWLDRLAQEITLIAPMAVGPQEKAPGSRNPAAQGQQVFYREVGSSAQIAWDFTRTALSAREHFMPKTETLFTIETGPDGRTVLHEMKLEEPRVFFGIRPCDARGLRVLDAVMLGQEPADVYYAQRRENTTLVGLACPQMWADCFCNSVGGAPDASDDVDILLTQVEGGFAVQVVTEKGERLAAGMGLQEVEGLELPQPKLNEQFVLPTQQQWLASFNDVYWQRVGDRCLSCRICSYVCPTCRCFDVRDETVVTPTGERIVRRVRAWDSCQGVNYRVQAGGANPRANLEQRLRNRFYCKYYYVPIDYAADGCVGCGRCVTACPVNIDIREVLQDLARRELA